MAAYPLKAMFSDRHLSNFNIGKSSGLAFRYVDQMETRERLATAA